MGGTREEALSYSLIKSPQLRDEVFEHSSALLVHWENMALSIYAGVSAEDVAREMTSGLMMSYVNVFSNFITKSRKENPKSYEYLLKLTQEWLTKPRHQLDIRKLS